MAKESETKHGLLRLPFLHTLPPNPQIATTYNHPSTSSSTSLVRSLLLASKELESLEKPKLWHHTHTEHVARIVRRIRILSVLFQELHDKDVIIPPSATVSLTELLVVIHKTKVILADKTTSFTWDLMGSSSVSRGLQEITRDMGRALEMLPLGLLTVSHEVREHVDLVRIRATAGYKPDRDEEESNLRRELEEAVTWLEAKEKDLQRASLRELFQKLGLDSLSKCRGEIRKLRDEIAVQADKGAAIDVMDRLRSLIGLMLYAKSVLFDSEGESEEGEEEEDCTELVPCSPTFRDAAGSGSKDKHYMSIPDELKCPISLDLMRDPVIVDSGHTYDRVSISGWLDSGHSTCPLSGQKLPRHPALIPNYALRSLVSQWCDRHKLPFHLATSAASAAAAADEDAVKMTAAFLVGKLATGSREIQTQAAYELRLLAKRGKENRKCVAEAGAIPFLVPLLSPSSEGKAQENAVTALLNLSINDNNKALIMAASGAVDGIVGVLQESDSMVARENAAATLFSLSLVDDYKIAIGAKDAAIPALVTLLREGNSRGKKDAATALFNLSVYNGNKAAVLKGGTVGVLVDLVVNMECGACVITDALALLSVLAGFEGGLEEIVRSGRALVPALIDVVKVGSEKGKENAIAVLAAMCKSDAPANREETVSKLAENIIPILQTVTSMGSSRAKRKAISLLKLLTAHPMQPNTSTCSRLTQLGKTQH
ncbi:hypothetical protein KI387_019629 [Taxus chinensis]|uniref:RING-type E3 ubiquitin transferase n=1 Tax=Taxus chinensis TaxID=29808 RepID=A0AA38GAG0_TAXCH|nr:hypothetical protein KI387_019629 [Taxus chinensis]